MFVITTTNAHADPTPGYHPTDKDCPGSIITVMRCATGGAGCDVSGQCFCDDPC